MTKDRKLSSSPVFSYAATGTIGVNGGGGGNANTGNGAQGQITDQTSPNMPGLPGSNGNGTNGGMSGAATGNIQDQPIPAATTAAIPVHYGCSTRRSLEQGNIAESTSLTVKLMTSDDGSGQPACTFSDTTLRGSILQPQTKAIPLSLVNQYCPNLADGKYYVFVSETDRATDLNWADDNGLSTFAVTRNTTGGSSQWSIQENDFLTLVTDFNDQESGGAHAMLALTDSQCDVQASPLMVRLEAPGEAPERLTLSSPVDGVLFDILGANATPAPYSPVRISWARSEPQFFFIALPDQSGQVRGVDQLFGDNTKGPDGQFAANGFLALAKYDDNKDGFITAADSVFANLRMWRDDNGDGVAQASELYTLAALGITSIDLGYDPNYHEADQYGNEIKYKSIVRTADGRMHIIFDLWFIHK